MSGGRERRTCRYVAFTALCGFRRGEEEKRRKREEEEEEEEEKSRKRRKREWLSDSFVGVFAVRNRICTYKFSSAPFGDVALLAC